MKKFRLLNVLVAALCVWMLASCGSEEANKLLSTVPENAMLVMSFNGDKIADNAGCSISGTKIKFSNEIKELAEKDNDMEELIETMEKGDFGINLSTSVFFIANSKEGEVFCFTALIEDQDKFVKACEEQFDKDFEDEGDFMVRRDIVVGKEQVWIGDFPDWKVIKKYSELDKEESFANHPMASKVSDMGHAANCIVDITALIDLYDQMSDSYSNNQEVGMMRTAVSAVYKKAKYAYAYADLDGKDLKYYAEVLTAEGEQAPFNLDMGAIDASAIKSLQADGQLIGGLALTQDYMKTITDMASSMGGIPTELTDVLKTFNGTMAFAASANESYKISIGTTGITDQAKEMASRLANEMGGSAATAGDRLVIKSNNVPDGPISANDAASELSGAMMGVVFSTKDVDRYVPEFTGSFVWKESGNSAVIEGKATVPEGSFLKYMIEYSNK